MIPAKFQSVLLRGLCRSLCIVAMKTVWRSPRSAKWFAVCWRSNQLTNESFSSVFKNMSPHQTNSKVFNFALPGRLRTLSTHDKPLAPGSRTNVHRIMWATARRKRSYNRHTWPPRAKGYLLVALERKARILTTFWLDLPLWIEFPMEESASQFRLILSVQMGTYSEHRVTLIIARFISRCQVSVSESNWMDDVVQTTQTRFSSGLKCSLFNSAPPLLLSHVKNYSGLFVSLGLFLEQVSLTLEKSLFQIFLSWRMKGIDTIQIQEK